MRLLAAVIVLLLDGSSALAQQALLDRQKDCAAQAGQVFHQLGWKKGQLTEKYESHWNPEFDKCFAVFNILTISPSFITHSWQLFDTYERLQYAELNVTYQTGKPEHIVTCILHSPIEDERYCASKEEFSAFVTRYMEAPPSLR